MVLTYMLKIKRDKLMKVKVMLDRLKLFTKTEL